MARIFITGSTDGIGLLTAKKLVADGHQVVLHARSQKRAADAQAACPGAEAVLVGDLSNLAETKALAAEASSLGSGKFDCVIHNAGVYRGQDNAVSKDTGFPRLFVVNTLAPYVLVALMPPPARLVFVSSSMHYGGRPRLDTMPRGVTYSDSKLHNVMLAKFFARKFGQETSASSVDPGWVPTKLGGRSAPDSIEDSVKTYEMAALGTGAAKTAANGAYFVNSREGSPQAMASDEALQDALVAKLAELSGVTLSEGK
ncbi:hypothetical protein SBRCBS47491_004755 [Sporothrix bragantina]|uniref:Short chain dehydrogenase n=1 Tax=Sporothrix bragantina TaxID=671064 RepID=A0ABP0BR15_9PEZI